MPSARARIGFGILAVAGLFIWLAGVFRDSIPHLLAGVVAFPCMVMAALILSWTFRQAPARRTIHPVLVLIALGLLAMLISMVADVGMPGLQQRVFISLFLLWLSIMVHRMRRAASRPTG